MNGVHDLGGLTCFGPVVPEADEPAFHEDWERRVFAMTLASLGGGLGPVDAFRHAIERMNGTEYLRTTYYEHWLAALETRAADRALAEAPRADEPLTVEGVEAAVPAGAPSERDEGPAPRFAVGDRVRTLNLNPRGHTRLPRYVRGRVGVVASCHGNHVFPDTAAHDAGEAPQPLYSVRFEASALWGPEAPARDALYIDLWDSYLEPAT